MTQAQNGAAPEKITYTLGGLEPKEVQFLIDMIVSVNQPLMVTQPIYQKIVGQVQAQDKAREEAKQQKQATKGGTDSPQGCSPVAPPQPHKPSAARRSKTK